MTSAQEKSKIEKANKKWLMDKKPNKPSISHPWRDENNKSIKTQ